MAGSDKLYIEPILKDLLKGITAATNGSTASLGDLMNSLNDVDTGLGALKNTMSDINGYLQFIASGGITTKERVFFPPGMLDDIQAGAAAADVTITRAVPNGRFEHGDKIFEFTAMYSGIVKITGGMHGTGSVANPGIDLIDKTVNIRNQIEYRVPGGASNVGTYYLGVSAGHNYELVCTGRPTGEGSGIPDEDLVFSDVQIVASVAQLSDNNAFIDTLTA